MDIDHTFQSLFIILTNLFIIPSTFLCYKLKLYYETFAILQCGIVSTVYHTNNEFFNHDELHDVLFYYDVYAAFQAFIALVVHNANYTNLHAKYTHNIGLLIIYTIATHNREFTIKIEFIMICTCIFSLIISFLLRRKKKKLVFKYFIPGIILVCIGLSLFNTQLDPYWLSHSLWHASIMTSYIFSN